MTATSALVLFSGGQDSTVCLAQALATYDHVETIGFSYGQRHAIELRTRLDVLERLTAAFPQWAARLGPDHPLELPTLGRISETSLTRSVAIEMADGGLPNTFVPGRNLLFFTYAAALGYRRGISTLVGGMCETDYSGYPDCRNDTLQTLATAISLGMAKRFEIVTPLMYVDKAGTWALAHEHGGDPLVDLIIEATHTCYLGDREHRHAWGYGCGNCPACDLRAKGWQTWQQAKTSRANF
ncbi:MAG: 7-cyano-7-deazaguanine synthase QueC [Hyphomicrobiaceae bacterium]|nr:7-cyano-7-deazaguanine synthase QueC [Hyphomicrobiaceae bacterium]